MNAGPLQPRRIALVRALALGDLLCATPAFRALRRRFPEAEITLVGLPWAEALVRRLDSLDRFLPFPGYPNIRETPVDLERTNAFLEEAHAARYDLAIQMHGSGGVSNGFVARLGATISAGYREGPDERLTIGLPWEEEHEIHRWLRLVALLGADGAPERPEFPLLPADRAAASDLLRGVPGGDGPLVGLHPGASDPTRRWPPARFAALGDRLASELGARLVLTGGPGEEPLTGEVRQRMSAPALDLAERTDLGSFAATLARLDLLVTNDTGASHLAAAVATPSVVLFGPTRPERWAPLDRTLHHPLDAPALIGDATDGATALHDLPVAPVLDACHGLLGGTPRSIATPPPRPPASTPRLNILIWHIHGSYLNSLARIDHDWWLPTKPGRPEGYGGRGPTFDLPANVREVPAEQVRDLDLDLIVYQTPKNLAVDAGEILSPAQRRLPRIYLEHNTPKPDAVNTRHPVDDPRTLLVHVTHFNRLMWDNGTTPTAVIEHSVAIDPAARYTGDLARGITVVNGMEKRPRVAGHDLFLQARQHVPLDAAGMGTEALGGLGDVPYRELHHRMGRYRFLYSPMRYTSLPLTVIEAMTLGMPVVALATTELPSVIEHGVSGFVSCDPEELIAGMRRLLDDPDLARRMGARASETARRRFGLERFARDWNLAFARAIDLAGSDSLEGRQELVGAVSGERP